MLKVLLVYMYIACKLEEMSVMFLYLSGQRGFFCASNPNLLRSEIELVWAAFKVRVLVQ